MKKIIVLLLLCCQFTAQNSQGAEPHKIMVVDSYHPEYVWSQQINEGFSAAMLNMGYFDDKKQIDTFTADNFVKTSRALFKKEWMDTKRKKSKEEIGTMILQLTRSIREFQPDILFLGDDNAADYIGNQFLDTDLPMVFWGVNNTPVKYGLVDSIDRPGHNVTGVYQTTYYKDSLQLLKTIVPTVKTFAILSDDTTTGRIHNKAIQFLASRGQLPLELIETVSTNDYDVWKNKALELQTKVDSFFIAASTGLKDSNGVVASNEEVATWYLKNIHIPEASGFKYRVEQGWLCAADDSGYNQGYEAAVIANDILVKGLEPATYPARVPKRGPLMVNKERAGMLGITLTEEMGIEVYIEKALALHEADEMEKKKRIFIVDSYHKDYIWSQKTQEGFSAAMLNLGYFDDKEQIADFDRDEYAESSKAIFKRAWLDSKRQSSKSAQEENSSDIYRVVSEFKPNIIFLGDDNAAQYIGTKFWGTDIPVIFWGVNNTPVKYGLLDSLERPGHNVTGVYQAVYYQENLQLLKNIVPQVETYAVLSDNSQTGRNFYKAIEHLDHDGKLPLKLSAIIATDDYEEWQKKALELQKKVDAFFLVMFSTLKDDTGKVLSDEEVIAWYLNNIHIPEVTMGHRVKFGLLCGAEDSPYLQGYEAGFMGKAVLDKRANPATFTPQVPARGPLKANRKRAAMLGIALTDAMGIEEYLDTMPSMDK